MKEKERNIVKIMKKNEVDERDGIYLSRKFREGKKTIL